MFSINVLFTPHKEQRTQPSRERGLMIITSPLGECKLRALQVDAGVEVEILVFCFGQ